MNRRAGFSWDRKGYFFHGWLKWCQAKGCFLATEKGNNKKLLKQQSDNMGLSEKTCRTLIHNIYIYIQPFLVDFLEVKPSFWVQTPALLALNIFKHQPKWRLK